MKRSLHTAGLCAAICWPSPTVFQNAAASASLAAASNPWCSPPMWPSSRTSTETPSSRSIPLPPALHRPGHHQCGRRPGVRGRGRRDDQRLPLRPAGGVRRAPGGLRRCGQRPHPDETITQIKHVVDIPVIATIISSEMDVARRVRAGADILNISGPHAPLRSWPRFEKISQTSPSLPPGGPTEEDILPHHPGRSQRHYLYPSLHR